MDANTLPVVAAPAKSCQRVIQGGRPDPDWSSLTISRLSQLHGFLGEQGGLKALRVPRQQSGMWQPTLGFFRTFSPLLARSFCGMAAAKEAEDARSRRTAAEKRFIFTTLYRKSLIFTAVPEEEKF